MNDQYYMHLALLQAQQAQQQGEIPVGCIITCGEQIVGRGHNLTENLQDITAHAEIQAITAAAQTLGGKYLNECTLYVTLEPCAMCAGAIGWAQVKRLVYGASDPKRGYTTFAPKVLHPKCTVSSGILTDECQNIIQEFFAKKRPSPIICNR